MSRPPMLYYDDWDRRWHDAAYDDLPMRHTAEDDDWQPVTQPVPTVVPDESFGDTSPRESEQPMTWPWKRDPERKGIYTLETPSGTFTTQNVLSTPPAPDLPDVCAWCHKAVKAEDVTLYQTPGEDGPVWCGLHRCGWNVYDSEEFANFVRYG